MVFFCKIIELDPSSFMKHDMEEQFLAAYDAYANALFRHCYFRVYDRELAKNLVQETFMRTWSFLVDGKEIKNIRAFLYRILTNLIIDESRKKKALSLNQLEEEGFSPAQKFNVTAEDRLMVHDSIRKLTQLEEPYREVMRLRFIDDLPVKEIAIILNVSSNVVSVRIHRGIKLLKKLLKS